jgi:hypothetical protein
MGRASRGRATRSAAGAPMTDPADALEPLADALNLAGARYVLIGVSGVNCYALDAGSVFSTQDRDIFLPLDPENLLSVWQACDGLRLRLLVGREPLDSPRDHLLAERVVSGRTLIRATDDGALAVDLTLVMAGFEFDEVWRERRIFRMGQTDIPVARLEHIVRSKHAAGRDKDRLFLATHRDALEQMLRGRD